MIKKIYKKLITEEPMYCQREGCKEELNGLMRHWIDLGDEFIFEMWLCADCTEEFEKKFQKQIRIIGK